MRVAALTGPDLEAALEDLARLRLRIFRDWPYLYDGDLAYEQAYLAAYRNNPDAILIAAFDGPRIVGAATGMPLHQHDDTLAAVAPKLGVPARDIFYCAESLLLPEHRGQGIGHLFFDHREGKARALGCSHACFCAVIRPTNHPARPTAYHPLDGFWQKRGYALVKGVTAQLSWKDLGHQAETPHDMQFWMTSL